MGPLRPAVGPRHGQRSRWAHPGSGGLKELYLLGEGGRLALLAQGRAG